MKILQSILFFSSVSMACLAQKATFTDPRDNIKYPIIKLDAYWWFQADLRYKTPTSWCSENPEHIKCSETNFYYFSELPEACPQGWRIPTWKEWESAVEAIKKIRKIPDGTVKDVSPFPYKKLERERVDLFMGIDLLNDTTTLNIKEHGWIEGRKWEMNGKPANLWTTDEPVNDPPAHIHMDKNIMLKHAHTHNIEDKRHRVRRFTVRCVMK